jgi:hypothetical protein
MATHEKQSPWLTIWCNSDNIGDKPWIDAATNAQWTFWSTASEWLPTWGKGDERGMTVKSVKMWQSGRCGATQEL